MVALSDAYFVDARFGDVDGGYDDANVQRLNWLTDAVKASYESMLRYRRLNKCLVEAYAGPGFLGRDKSQPKYLEKLAEAIDAYVTLLTGGDPQVSISTQLQSLDWFALTYQQSLNQLAKEIHLRETIEQWVEDACILIGIIKTHVADSGETIFAEGLEIDPGVPNASNLLLDDWVVDMSAKNMRSIKFAGDKYRIPWREFKSGVKMGLYDEFVAKDARPTTKLPSADGVVDAIRAGDAVDADDIEPMIDLADVWVQREGKVYTFLVIDPVNFVLDPRPIACMEWQDTENGPYHILGFRRVQGAIFPKSPAVHLHDISSLIDNIASLTARQAKRQKNLTFYASAAEDTANRVRSAPDGAVLRADDPTGIKPFVIPGADPSTVNLLLQLLQLFDVSAGNLTALMGLGAQTGTVGQESLIHQAGNRKVAWMQDRVVHGVSGLFRSLGLMLWVDQWKTITTKLPIPGAESYTATLQWTANERAGNFFDYNFSISASSLQSSSPQQEADQITQLMLQIFIPLAEQVAAQGGRIDLAELADMFATLLNKPRIRKLVVFDRSPADAEEQPSTGLKKPPTSTRHYVRHNTGGGDNPQSRLADYFSSAPSHSQQFAS